MSVELAALAERAARAAGALLLDHASRAPVLVETKSSPTDLVSAADRASERLLVDLLLGERPDDGVIGEEDTRREGSSGLTWVCDPLDGTTNYLYRLPAWAVSIAVEDDRGPVAACVYDPSRDEAFTACRGGGATLNGVVVASSALTELPRALIGTGFSYDAQRRAEQAARLVDVVAAVRDLRRGGSAALDLAHVACGRLDGFFESGLNHWDYAAGRLLVEEAGGRCTFEAGPFAEPTVVAAAPALHAALAAII